MKSNIFWFRRDLRLEDNTALIEALNSSNSVVPIFIFDSNILKSLPKDDARITFIYSQLRKINNQLKENKSSILVKHGDPKEIFQEIILELDIKDVYSNILNQI